MSTLTPSQEGAIAARGNVLVSAGAGAGKTRTLVERCLRLVLEEGVSLDRILMVTFTEAAAAEMRQRLREALQKQRDPAGTGRVSEQLALLDTAHISTLHSFCFQLVREHFHELAIDPDVTVLDKEQTRPLIAETLDALLERHYVGDTPESSAVQELIRRFGRRSDGPIRELVTRLHIFTQTLPEPERWLEQQLAVFEEAEPLRWREQFTEAVREWAGFWLPELQPHLANENVVASERALNRLAEKPSLADAIAAARAVVDADNNKTGWPRGSKGRHREPISRFFDDAAMLGSLVESSDGTDPLQQDWTWTHPHMSALARLTREFTTEFTKAKRELGGVDFADLEQLASLLLEKPAVAARWRGQFDFLFVDECQDINGVQDAILCALSRDGAQANRFLAGDVKQSIYRFRLADPAIFANYERHWGDSAQNGSRMPLSENFRSHESLLRFVNAFFALLLRRSVGGVDYGEDSRLVFGDRDGRREVSLDANPVPRVELHVLPRELETESAEPADNGDRVADELPDLTTVQREARLVAQRLKALEAQAHEGRFNIWDKEAGQFRPAQWRDMVVLLRSPRRKVETYAREFHEAGVPLHARCGGFFGAQEVVDLLSLLRVLDNPFQDIPLLAVLRSPLVAMSLEELVEVRTGRRLVPMWEAVREFHREKSVVSRQLSMVKGAPKGTTTDNGQLTTDSAYRKVDWFLSRFSAWRDLLRHASLTDSLETTLAETHFEALLLAGDRGPERVANVRRLLDLARQFDPWQRQGLFRFLRFIEAQQDEELDREPAPPTAQNAVRLMSIHQSKGLEFPVVVVADLGKQFNLDSLREDVLLNAKLGICPKVAPPDTDQCYASAAWWLASARERRELLGEELRLLYVAFTRSRDRLILTGTEAKGNDPAKRWQPEASSPVTDAALIEANCALHWVQLWLRRNTTAEHWQGERTGANEFLRWTRHAAESLAQLEEDANQSHRHNELEKTDDEDVPRFLTSAAGTEGKARLEWRYGFEPATREPAKTSVSALRRRPNEEDEEAVSRPRRNLRFSIDDLRSSPVRVGDGAKLSAAERGTAHHTFLELVALDRTGCGAELMAEADRLHQTGLLSAEEVSALDLTGLAAFWQGGLGRRIREHSAQVQRELAFTARFSPTELAGRGLFREAAALQSEFVVVQGRVDLAVMLPDEIWLVDFKSDEVTAASLDRKKGQYESQLKLYALALERIYSRPIKEAWLHFLVPGESVRL
jgi:ATP-dependent helicase/nuclease subunit A